MYSFSSFFSNFISFGQAKTEVSKAKEQSSSTQEDKADKAFLANRNHGGPGTGDKFGRYGEGEYEKHVTQNGKKEYKNSFVIPERPPTATKKYTDNLVNKKLDYSNANFYKRAYKGYSTNSIFSSGVSRLSKLTSLFDFQINSPRQSFGFGNRSSRWT